MLCTMVLHKKCIMCYIKFPSLISRVYFSLIIIRFPGIVPFPSDLLVPFFRLTDLHACTSSKTD